MTPLSATLAALDDEQEKAAATNSDAYEEWCDTAWQNRATIRAALALAEEMSVLPDRVPLDLLTAYRDAAGKGKRGNG